MAAKRKPQQGTTATPRTQQIPTQIQLDKTKIAQLMDLKQAGPIIEAIEKKRGGTRLLTLVYNENPPVPSMFTTSLLNPLSTLWNAPLILDR